MRWMTSDGMYIQSSNYGSSDSLLRHSIQIIAEPETNGHAISCFVEFLSHLKPEPEENEATNVPQLDLEVPFDNINVYCKCYSNNYPIHVHERLMIVCLLYCFHL